MRIGIITFTDGRKRAADMLEGQCRDFQQKLADHLESQGHKVTQGNEIVWNFAGAVNEAKRMNEADVDAVLFNFCVWAYPDFVAQAARDVDAPICIVGNINPAFPGWVAYYAAAGTLDEFDVPFGRVLGNIDDSVVAKELDEWLARNTPSKRERGIHAAARLRGLRYGEFDGPSMGMYTGHIDPSQWMEQFGIHVFHRSQLTLAWLAQKVSDDRVEQGLQWLESHCKEIKWNDERLRPGVDGQLGKQVRLYLAIKDYCKEEGIDFLGLTGQLDYTEWPDGVIMDVPEAILNDIADWEESAKDPLICATECDSNGALTMQILNHLSGTPVLFADLRHYFADENVYDLCNSGQHAPWFATTTSNVEANWKQVTLHPSNAMYFPHGGASVEFFAAAQEKMTFARLTRKSMQYRMHFFTGSFVRFGDKDERLSAQTSPDWPHAFARFDCDKHDLAQRYSSNHIHAICGDWMGEIQACCEALGIETVAMS